MNNAKNENAGNSSGKGVLISYGCLAIRIENNTKSAIDNAKEKIAQASFI